MEDIDYDRILNETREFINIHLMPIINSIGEPLEGNLFMYHLTTSFYDEFVLKQKNLIICSLQPNIKEVLEIGFNSGFSALLLLIANPNINLTCVDIGIHKYTIPCYNKIKEFYGDKINLQLGNSVDVVKNLPKFFDLVHIDGAHEKLIATEDIINSYYICNRESLLIMDDYDIPVLNNLWNDFCTTLNLNNVSFNYFENPYQSIKHVYKFKYITGELDSLPLIPKIIHQIGPSDKSKWHPIWIECQKTWLKNFPESEYEYKLWNDEEDLENLIRNDFPFFIDMFNSYSKKIKKIDMARYFILFKYGGIYADLDFICYKDFYSSLDNSKANIACSPWTSQEYLQNSLMASPKNNRVFLYIIDEAKRRFTDNNELMDISSSTGPKLISDVYDRLKSFIVALDKEKYNPIGCKALDNEELYNENTCYCKHYGTGQW
jgi:mannosyltransferase OCH1-like enzyme